MSIFEVFRRISIWYIKADFGKVTSDLTLIAFTLRVLVTRGAIRVVQHSFITSLVR